MTAPVGYALLHATAVPAAVEARESAGRATFLFAVLGILLFLFFTVVLLIAVSRALRRKRRDQASEPTDISVDAWSEAGKRLGRGERP
jgi:hypothetical protein